MESHSANRELHTDARPDPWEERTPTKYPQSHYTILYKPGRANDTRDALEWNEEQERPRHGFSRRWKGEIMNETATSFAGFALPTERYFSLPNEWVNICAQITNLAELKVLIYIARHTWGFHEYDVARLFTLDELMQGRKRKDGSRMDQGTGLSRQGVVDGLQRALADGYLICETDETDRGRIKKCYRLKMCEEQASAPVPAVKDADACGQERRFQQSTMQTVVKDADASSQQGRLQESTMQTSEVKRLDTSSQERRRQQSARQTSGVNDADACGQECRPRSEKNTQEKHLEKNTREKHGKKDTCEKQAPDAHALSLSAEAQMIYDAWCSLFTVEVPLTPAIAKAAQELAQPVARWAQELTIVPAELLKRMMHWLYEMDKTGYYRRGVKLHDLAREFEAWQAATERQMRKKSGQRPVPELRENPYSIAALMAAQKSRRVAAQKGDEQK